MPQVVNKIYHNTFKKMWCLHGHQLHSARDYNYAWAASGNQDNHGEGTTSCQGLNCPALVLLSKEGDKWSGYCGETFGFLGPGVGE